MLMVKQFLGLNFWNYLQKWEGLVVGWLYKGLVNVNGGYSNGDAPCLESVVPRIDSEPE